MNINQSISPNSLAALKNSGVWKSISSSKHSYSTISTGFSELDELLALRGWPLETTTELALNQSGIGELRLLLPALKQRLNASGKNHIVWIAPPHRPFAPALFKQNIDPNKLIIVRPKGVADTLWSIEQALLSKSCAAVFSWTGNYKLNSKESRRLQLAVERSNTWHVQFRHSLCLTQPSAARLRLQLTSTPDGHLNVLVCKQPQGGGDLECTLSVQPGYQHWQRIPTELLPHSNAVTKTFNKRKRSRLGHSLLVD